MYYTSPVFERTFSPIKKMSMQPRPIWEDELFCKMDNFETKLNKLDKIDSLVTKLNAWVIKKL